jgi:hypothetical protein
VAATGFRYTFANEDAVLGKVTLKVVSLIGVLDALPADNEAISSPTKGEQLADLLPQPHGAEFDEPRRPSAS